MPHPNAFSPSWFEGPEFFAKNIGVFNNFLPKKYEGFHSSVVEQWSSNARVPGSNPSSAKTFFLYILPFKILIGNFVKVHFAHKVLVKCDINIHKYQN